MAGLGSSTGKTDTYHHIWEGSYTMLYFNHILIMFAQVGIQIGIRSSKANCNLSKTNVIDSVFN